MRDPLIRSPTRRAVQRAALHILDAWTGTKRVHPREGPVLRRLWLIHLSLHRPVNISLVLLLTLGFLEQPSWQAGRGPHASNATLYPVFGLPVLPEPVSITAEAFMLAILAIDAVCSTGAQGWVIVTGVRRKLLYVLTLTAALVEAVFAACGLWTCVRVAPFLRLLLLVLQSDALLSQLDMVRRTIPQILGVFLVLLTFLLAYAWAAVLLFEGAHSFTAGGLGAATWNLFICLTTANFPDVMMTQYSRSRATALFFAPFLLLGNFFLLNLVLAVVVQAHSDSVEHTARLARDAQQRSLRAAFGSLARAVSVVSASEGVVGAGYAEGPAVSAAADGTVDGAAEGASDDNVALRTALPREMVDDLFTELNYYRSIAHIGSARAELLFAALDRSGDDAVDLSEFLSFCELLRVRFERAPERSGLERLSPSLASSQCWRSVTALVRSHRFDYGVDALLVVAGVALVIEEQGVLQGHPEDFDSSVSSIWNVIELLLSVLFLVEVVVKLLALGWDEYTRSLKNVFDALATLSTCAVVVVVYVPNAVSDSRYIRLVLLMRLLRLLRLLSLSPHVRFVSSTFLATLPQAQQLLKLLFVLLYVFAALGVELYGGRINLDPNSPELALLMNTTYVASGYYANNFNDLASGFVTCFELLLVNNWFVLCEGFVAVTSVWSRAYFVLFYAIGPLIILNVAVAFCIEAFLAYVHSNGLKGGGLRRAGTAPGVGLPCATTEDGALVDTSIVSGSHTGLSEGWQPQGWVRPA